MTKQYEKIANALFINYESLYDINMDTGEYACFTQSGDSERFRLTEQGEDFFEELKNRVPETVVPDDQEYVLQMLSREALLRGTGDGEYYSFVYRICREGWILYHKIRAKQEHTCGHTHIYLGIRDVDYWIKEEQKHADRINFLLQKENTHMKAILASAEGYLEINLSRDEILDKSVSQDRGGGRALSRVLDMPEMRSYSQLNRWILKHLVAMDSEVYMMVSAREYLIAAYHEGKRRVSMEYAFAVSDTETQSCRQVFYLYRDETSRDIMSFSVIYDLTEEQRKEMEMRELEQSLQLCRIRNFTGQMQPHFLYNALGSIQEIVLEDPAYASDLLGDFTTYLRGCIRSMSEDRTIGFSQELENIRAYANIEKMRFGDKLNVVYDLRTTAFSVLPLSIQPLVENAIRHGVYRKGKKGGTVTIRTWEDDDTWRVQVEDDGAGFDYQHYLEEMSTGATESTGLKNTMFRLSNVLGAHIDVTSQKGEGTTVTVMIPKTAGAGAGRAISVPAHASGEGGRAIPSPALISARGGRVVPAPAPGPATGGRTIPAPALAAAAPLKRQEENHESDHSR